MSRLKPGDRVYAVRASSARSVELYGFGVYVGDEVPPAPIGAFAAFFGVETWEEFDRHSVEAVGHAIERPTNPKIQLDDGRVVWGAECWWGPEEDYLRMFGSLPQERV